MNTRGILSAWSIVSVALLAVACDSKSSAPTPAGSSVAPKDTASAGVDMKATCEKMCDKTVDCAEDMAKSEGAPDDTVKSAKAMAKEGLAECKKSCGDDAAKATDKDKAQASKVQDCLSKACPDYLKCMDAID